MFRRHFFSSLTLAGLFGATETLSRTSTRLVRRNYKAQRFTCKGCAFGLEAKLRSHDGVKLAFASYPECDVVVEFDDTLINDGEIKRTAEELGYILIDAA
jgi:copper chaperone CopZ